MKVYELIKGFELCEKFSLNLRDEDDIVWFFGDIKDAMDKVPGWCLDKVVKEFNVVPIYISSTSPTNTFMVMVHFCE